MIRVLCECGRQLSAKDTDAGKRARCPFCARVLQLPGERAADTAALADVMQETGSSAASAATDPSRTVPPLKLGRYVLLGKLGEGAMGQVWLARDPRLEREVAIKLLPAELRRSADLLKRFRREAKLAGRLQHPNVVTIHDVADEGQQLYLVMERVDGGSLEELVRERGALHWREATRAIRDAAAGLGAAHHMGLVHRDIKPANLLRNSQGVTKVADFGLARLEAGDTQLTQLGSLLGTPTYMAPEQWQGGQADERSDLYALICSYYYLLTGQTPFGAPNHAALGYQHRYEPFPDARLRVPELPKSVLRILSRGSEKDPALRYQNANQLLTDLEGALMPASPPPPRLSPRGARISPWSGTPQQRRLAGWAMTLGAAVAALTLMTQLVGLPTRKREPASVQPASEEANPGTIVNSLGMKFVLIPAGEFTMGSPPEEVGRDSGEVQHQVRISRPFYLSVHEVTVSQFRRFVDETGYWTQAEKNGTGGWGISAQGQRWEQKPEYTWRTPSVPQNDRHPVVQVSWHDAQAFCVWLSGRERCQCRLPTEAEWEYACRAGSESAYGWGDDPLGFAEFANLADAAAKRRFPQGHVASGDDGFVFTSPVGHYQPNRFGLYDMHGNVWEWCDDWYGPYSAEPQTDPKGPKNGDKRVLRGGSFLSDARNLRSALRLGGLPDDLSYNHGFRVARTCP